MERSGVGQYEVQKGEAMKSFNVDIGTLFSAGTFVVSVAIAAASAVVFIKSDINDLRLELKEDINKVSGSVDELKDSINELKGSINALKDSE